MPTFTLVDLSQIKMDSSEGRQALFEFATEGILIADKSGTILQINPAAERIFGYNSGELNGKKIENLIPSRYNHKHLRHRENYHQNPHPRSMGSGVDLYGLRKDQSEFPVEISLSPFRNQEGTYVIAFIIDISQRKKNEDAIKKQNEELEKLAEKLRNTNSELENRVKERTNILEEALHELENSREELRQSLEKEKDLNELKSRFVAMASHEFRTPLATILSSLSLASQYSKQGETEKQSKHVDRIKGAVTHMTDLLNDVLSISKLEEGKIPVHPEWIDLAEFLDQTISEMRLLSKNNQDIRHTHTGEKYIELDKKILRNILFNLITNAIKFSNENQTIEIRSDLNDKLFSLQIKDKGIGISQEDKKHLFERFFRGQNATNIQGTGLGLNIVLKYLEVLNGEITCESVLGEGTTFTVKIINPNKK